MIVSHRDFSYETVTVSKGVFPYETVVSKDYIYMKLKQFLKQFPMKQKSNAGRDRCPKAHKRRAWGHTRSRLFPLTQKGVQYVTT